MGSRYLSGREWMFVWSRENECSGIYLVVVEYCGEVCV